MPVLSSSPPPGVPALTSSSSYLLLAGALVLLVLGTTLSRLRRHFNYLSHSSSSFSPSPSFNSSSMEKTQLVPESPSPKSSPSPSSPQYGPSSTNPPLRLPGPADPVYTSPRTSIVALSQSLSSSSTSSSSSPSEPLVIVDLDTPRRRSYTKLTPAGTEVSGEVVVAEGWRRHTKVFGGGVCAACEENERRLAQVRSGAAAPGSFVFPPAAPPAGAQGMA